MRWRAALLAHLLALASLAGAAQAEVRGADDQLWTELDLDAPLADRLTVSGLAALRTGDGLPNPTFVAGGGALSYEFAPHWSVGAGDYWVRVRSPVSGGGLDLELPLVAVTYAARLAGLEVDDRNRAERIVGLAGEGWRYRNRLSVSHPLLFGPVKQVFVSDEVFYDASRDSWSRNRAQVGVGLAPVGRTALQLYVLRQDDRFSHPGHLNILGFALAVKLGPLV